MTHHKAHTQRWRLALVHLLQAMLLVLPVTAWAATLRWAPPSDALSLDPHAQNEVLSNSINAHLYERLTARDEQLSLVPGLASNWRQTSPLAWRFQLRSGVRFHDGSLLTGEDVVFSVQRAQNPASAVAQYARGLGTAVHLGQGLIEFRLQQPNPVLLDHVDAVPIMSLAWSRTHGVLVPLSHKLQQESHAKHHAMGTGPYRLLSRQPDTRTVLVRHDAYWGTVKGNVTRLEVVPISNAFTRTAALVNGEIHLVTSPSGRDLERLAATPGLKVRQVPENRVVFLGFDQHRDTLQNSSARGPNPLKDRRVRQAMAHAIDQDAIRDVVLRAQAVPTGCLLPAALTCQRIPELEQNRPRFDLALSRRLLADAGHGSGFSLAMDCPNDRNANDEVLCVALAGMLAKVGIQVQVQTLPRAQFFPKLDRLESSFYLMAWGGAELDPQPTLEPLMHSFDAATGRGEVNFGRFADRELDALIASAAVQTDAKKRWEQIRQALLRHQSQLYHLPLYRQTLSWAMRQAVQAEPAPNNHMRAWFVTVHADR